MNATVSSIIRDGYWHIEDIVRRTTPNVVYYAKQTEIIGGEDELYGLLENMVSMS